MATTPRSLLSRLSPYFLARLCRNSRLLSSSSAPALREPRTLSPEYPSESPDDLHLTDSCVRRMKELQADEGREKLLRLSIEAGGCSGFQYNFSLDDTINGDDRVFEQDGVKVVVDKISHGFVKGATVDFAEELIRSAFQIYLNTLKHLYEQQRDKKFLDNSIQLWSIFGKLYAEPIIRFVFTELDEYWVQEQGTFKATPPARAWGSNLGSI